MSRTAKLFLLLLLGGILPSKVFASIDLARGNVDLQGSILNAPCTIDTDSRDQSIDMGIIPIGEINKNGRSAARPFSIRVMTQT